MATAALLASSNNATGAQMARSPAPGVIKLSTRLIALNATTTHTSQRDARDHSVRTSPARDITTATIVCNNREERSGIASTAGRAAGR